MNAFFFRRLGLLGLALLAGVVAWAQTGGGAEALYQRWNNNSRGDAAKQKEAYAAAKEYLERFGQPDDKFARPMRPWVRRYEAELVRAKLPALLESLKQAQAAKDQVKAMGIAEEVLVASPNDVQAWTVVAEGRTQLTYLPALAAYRAKFDKPLNPEAKAAWTKLSEFADRVIAAWARVAVHAIKPGEERLRADALTQLHAVTDAIYRGSLFAPANALARARLEQKEGESLADGQYPDPNDPKNGGAEYLRGLAAGQDRDYAKALPEIRAAVAKNNAAAMYWLAEAYLDGWGVEKSVPLARSLYLRAIVHGDSVAPASLSLIDDPLSDNKIAEFDRAVLEARGGNVATAHAEYAKAAEKGSVEAMARLAAMGKDDDPTVAMAWWRRAADRGHVEAMNQLGLAYRDGKGVLQDAAQARAWFKRAADQGNWDAAAALRGMAP